MLWNLIVAVLAVSIVVLGVRADQAELRKDAMVHLYGVGTCKSVGMMATPDCTPVTCPEEGFFTIENKNREFCTDVQQDSGWRVCTAVGERAECVYIRYEDYHCTEVVYSTVLKSGTDYDLTDYGPCP